MVALYKNCTIAARVNVNWIQVVQVRIQWCIVVNTVNNYRHHNRWEFG